VLSFAVDMSDRATSPLQIRRGIIPPALIDDALRLLHLDLLQRGASAAELGEWLWGAHWFPHLRHSPAIIALADALPPAWRTGARCDPQILLQFPHAGPVPDVTFHLDQEPDWAGSQRYRRIVGVPLTPWRSENGGLIVKPSTEPQSVELDPGDAVMMSPRLLHSGGINRTGAIRYGVYFRWLESSLSSGEPGLRGE
jgi:Phytanoyl-CoA dioxygenase (PhyH)